MKIFLLKPHSFLLSFGLFLLLQRFFCYRLPIEMVFGALTISMAVAAWLAHALLLCVMEVLITLAKTLLHNYIIHNKSKWIYAFRLKVCRSRCLLLSVSVRGCLPFTTRRVREICEWVLECAPQLIVLGELICISHWNGMHEFIIYIIQNGK